jgi:hypothetical protein
VRGEERAEGGGEELTTVVALEAAEGGVKLGFDEREETQQCVTRIGFSMQWEDPRKMREIVKDNQIIFITGTAYNRRCP